MFFFFFFVFFFSIFFFFFFFSSRRRHTRFDCDWSSDVCLPISAVGPALAVGHGLAADRALRDAARGERQANRQEGEGEAHQCPGCEWMRTVFLFMRFTTWPASWPQAASMSSPRVLRIVATNPASSRICWKRLMRAGSERSKPESSNGL